MVGAYKGIHPKLGGIGITSFVFGILANTYYTVLVCYALIYLFHAVTAKTLPWTDRENNIACFFEDDPLMAEPEASFFYMRVAG